jgi:hypothetical protein
MVSSNDEPRPFARSLEVPVIADSVEAPIVTYGDGPTSINFLLDDRRWGRVTFEKLDSIRVSRGEYEPYESSGRRRWVSTVSHSPWLRERYEYEKRHYGDAYEFGGNVDEMLRDFSHYVFHFHDQFVEVLSAGIWFETADECIGGRQLESSHPLLNLPESSVSHRFEAHGITCQVRRNPRSMDELVRSAAYCSQTLLQFAAELGGTPSVSWTVSLRIRDGKSRAYLKSYFGKVEEEHDCVPGLADVQPRIEAWLQEVQERRRQMGKA